MTDPDARPPAGRRPPQVLAAALVAFLVAFYLLMNALVLLAAVRILGLIGLVFGLVYLAVAAVDLGGGVAALTGRSGTVLRIAGLLTAGLAALGLVLTLVQGAFSLWLVLLVAAGAGIFFLLNQPASRQYFADRGTT
ncbi:hypothetical protein ACI782_19035 [Geodermatophilus sp. SYSU D00703]